MRLDTSIDSGIDSTIDSTSTLTRLLDDELAFSASIQGIYSSHLAMSLVALHQLGASGSVLESTFEATARSGPEIRDDCDELERRIREVDERGIDETVRALVPALVRGPGTALFHPLIRLAYALDVGHRGQVAAALLDWERRLHTPPVPVASPGRRRLADAAADLADHPSDTWPQTYDLDAIARRPELRASLEGVARDERSLDDISTFALSAHATADAFITLHMVTGARALRTVSEHVDADVAHELAAQAVTMMAIAYAAAGAPALLDEPALDAMRESPLPSSAEIAARAIESPDPHVIKLANVALVEELRTADRLYRYVAARVVGSM